MKYHVIYYASNKNNDGRIYPQTAEVRKYDNRLEVWDTTGWNGFNECENHRVAIFPDSEYTYPAIQEAMAKSCADLLCPAVGRE
jgi:hypothetical protein